jgi:hypothetical protein
VLQPWHDNRVMPNWSPQNGQRVMSFLWLEAGLGMNLMKLKVK